MDNRTMAAALVQAADAVQRGGDARTAEALSALLAAMPAPRGRDAAEAARVALVLVAALAGVRLRSEWASADLAADAARDLAARLQPAPARDLAAELGERDRRAAAGDWRAACGGAEVPFVTRSGRRLLYCYQASTGRHAYLDMDRDIILDADEAARLLP